MLAVTVGFRWGYASWLAGWLSQAGYTTAPDPRPPPCSSPVMTRQDERLIGLIWGQEENSNEGGLKRSSQQEPC